MKNSLRQLGFLAAACLSADAFALKFTYSVVTEVEYSDNLVQEDNPEGRDTSGTALTGGVAFDFTSDEGSLISTDLSGEFTKRRFSIGRLESDDNKFLVARVRVKPTTNNFSLELLNSLRQVKEDRNINQTVNNQRDVNTLSITPAYFFKLSSLSSITTEYQYISINDDDEGDSSRDIDSFTVGYERQLSGESSWSINARRLTTDFSDVDEEFDQDELFFVFLKEGGPAIYRLEVGTQKVVDVSGQDEDSTQTLLEFSALRRINSFSNLTFTYRQGFGDALSADLDRAFVKVNDNDQAAFIEGVVEERQSDIRYEYNKRDLQYSFELGLRQLETDNEVENTNADIDEDRYFFTANLSGRFSDDFGYGLSYRYTKDEFNLADQENDLNRITGKLSYFPSNDLETFFSISSQRASGDGPGNNFDENAVILGLRYSPRGRR